VSERTTHRGRGRRRAWQYKARRFASAPLVLAIVAAVLAIVPFATAATTVASAVPRPGQRIDMKVLLISADGREPTFEAWKAQLNREGVPFRAIVADQDARITDQTLADYGANRAYYQAVILATGDLVRAVDNADGSGTSYLSALSDGEWATLAKFERAFGVRQLSDNTFPTPAHGLNYPTASGDQGGATATLTPTGLAAFPYLIGNVPIDNGAFGYQATPLDPADFQPLLVGPGGAPYLGVFTHPDDGREEMVMTVDSNAYQLHNQLLRHGMLSWVTRGAYLGLQRQYLELQVDDVFLPDDRWDTVNHTTPEEGVSCGTAVTPACSTKLIRMNAADVTRALNWSKRTGLRLDMVFNGAGSVDAGKNDPLTAALVDNRAKFNWINHTYSHPNLDTLTRTQIASEIDQNLQWAKSKKISVNAKELVTGEHSGLKNPEMPPALVATGMNWVAADASRERDQYQIGPALTVPRYPTNVYYNTATRAEQLDEYNYIYLPPSLGGACQNTATTTCRSGPATWDEYVNAETRIMFRHVMDNDPRPHYFHQSNLAEDGIMYDVVDALLQRYSSYVKPSLVQLGHGEIGTELSRQARWRQAVAAGQVSGYLKDGRVSLTASSTVEVPVTGTTVGSAYEGQRSGWTKLTGGTTVTLDAADPANTVAPTVTGAAVDGSTLTAGTGTWTGTLPLTYAYQWQRCDAAGTACVNLDGATDRTYSPSAADVGSRLRVAVSASNPVSAFAMTRSQPTAVVAAAPPVSTAAPSIDGTAQVDQGLTSTTGEWSGTQPIRYAYQWQRCDAAGAACTAVSGATGATYTPTDGDAGGRLRAVVTATNAAGSASAASTSTAAVQPAP
jgi:hypothetical protein